jgi:zinc transport system substrate-binding protein
VGCRPASEPPREKPLIVASFFPLYDFARALAGPLADVRCVVPPGGDPHNAAASPGAARLVAGADGVILLGLGLDGWVGKLAAAERRPRVLEAGQGLASRPIGHADLYDPEHHDDHHHAPEDLDPHVWLDPALARQLVERIAASLAEILPAHRDELNRRTAALLGELDALDREFQAGLADLPQRAVVTFHGAFGYLFAQYGLEVAATIEPFPGHEPSARYLRELVTLMRGRGLKVVFAEPQLPDRAAQVLAREIGGGVERLDPCETILLDRPEATYLERQRANLATLRRVLSPAVAAP